MLFQILSIIALAAIFIWSSCKKIDTENNMPLKLRTTQMVNEFIAANPKPVTVTIDEKVAVVLTDENGNPAKRMHNNILLNSSGPNCFNPEEDASPSGVFESYATTLSCATSSRVYASYKVSLKNAPALANPLNPTQKTRGRIYITNTGTGTAVWSATSFTNLTIVNLGVDPAEPTHHLYRIAFEGDVPSIYWNYYGNTKRVNLIFYSECAAETPAGLNYNSNFTIPSTITTCNVVHPMWINSGSISGVAACTDCCSAYGPGLPSQQLIQFSTSTSFSTIAYQKILKCTETITTGITLTKGVKYYFRYKNGSTACPINTTTFVGGGPWSPVYSIIW